MERQAKQVLVMRTDLNMRKGKMIAQGAHASIAFLTNRIRVVENEHNYDAIGHQNLWPLAFSDAERQWIEGAFTKICVRADSEEELLAVHRAATDAGLTSKLIIDKGLTEFGGVPTATCVGVGPDWAEDVDKITGSLKLL